MQEHLIVATSQGVAVCQREKGKWREIRRSLKKLGVNCVIACSSGILAGTYKGLYRSSDVGETWQEASQGLSIKHVRWLDYHTNQPNFILTGTEPAAIFVSRDGGHSWRECPEVTGMRQEYGWRLPYSPEAGCVRGFTISDPAAGPTNRAYAAVEDGCVLVSNDGGEHWELAQGSRGNPDHRPGEGMVHSDVHSITVHPTSADLVYAPTGGGFFRSQDGGASWELLYGGAYTRAVWVDPTDSQHMILGPADGVDRNGRIEESLDGGQTWRSANIGLETPWPNHMVERFSHAGQELLGVLSNGEILAAPLDDFQWRRILENITNANALTNLVV
jgi:photosystem II stability/assembly factor-like uncharacterized protein